MSLSNVFDYVKSNVNFVGAVYKNDWNMMKIALCLLLSEASLR